MSGLQPMLLTLLKTISCWMTCTHTSYTFLLVHTTELVPSPGGKIHMVLDTVGHGVAFFFFKNWVTGLYFIWHANKYFWRPVKIPPTLAYIVDVGEMFVWQTLCYSFGDLKLFLSALIVYASFWCFRLFYKGKTVDMLRNANGGDYCNFYKSG
eukprot:TRINITY_DN4396_c0_g1_i2.p2 TRINITY_DN4396_c0_g1~~TRINITY_DN4396_c0_g1_i2.p2  ORF type:complete len:153 (-),score=37.39 TRINITY_DN4396_c0_g1_i2:104-562(-)